MTMSQWLVVNDDLTNKLPFETAEWLLEYGSLTEKLERTFRSVSVDVLAEENNCLDNHEELLSSTETDCFVRKVILSAQNKPLVFAKSIVSGNSCSIKSLGNKPLGKILFSDKSLQRKHFRVSKISQNHKLIKEAKDSNKTDLKLDAFDYLWARQSLWMSKNKDMELLLYEVFLPELGIYKNNEQP